MQTFSNLFPMTPAQSWAFLLLLFSLSALVAYLIWYLDIVAQLSFTNCKVVGAKGIIYAFRGIECYEILRERVIGVTRNEIGYRVSTSDGEVPGTYFIITSREDVGNPEYDEAIELAGDDEHLKKELLPPARVKNYFVLKNKETGESQEFFVVYLKYDNTVEVEEALNRYFDEEFEDICKTVA